MLILIYSSEKYPATSIANSGHVHLLIDDLTAFSLFTFEPCKDSCWYTYPEHFLFLLHVSVLQKKVLFIMTGANLSEIPVVSVLKNVMY
jgi:hypothetical protein